ncbi:hypothetical protein [Nocardioides sp. Root140]|uniref:hypothetical protein n=1 Tax=Nocardioides sp. Root140 TaxID=1736460 RepID=UPI0006F78FB2|nr:hypothetical protein [Nocardioides sp. Root140]KQY57522.1 hypothetical protein ASD30_15160 [Nocardioides sp. Root140]
MNTRHGFRLSRRSADKALDLRGGSGSPELDALLEAAAAPGPTSGEVPGEAGALAEFRVAGLVSASSTGRATSMKRATSRLLTAKALAVGVIAVSGVGGVALAATTGHLPNPAAGDHPNLGSSQDAPGLNANGDDPAADPTTGPADPSDAPSAEPTTGPSLAGLCKAFQAGESSGHAKNLTNPAFTALVTAAGDEASVSTYCVGLLGEPTARPEHPAKPEHPATPTHPAKPEHPVTPTHPEKPDTPATPEVPATPKRPVTPPAPTHPETPATPEVPTNPERPATPAD